MHPHSAPWLHRLAVLPVVALALGLAAPTARAEGEAPPDGEKKPEFSWQQGGEVSLAGDVAQLKLTEEERFLDGPQTIQLMDMLGNPTSKKEVGLVRPTVEGKEWALLFEWDPAGYVKDDEKDKIDAEALFESIRDGTEEANEFRKEKGMPGLHVVRWTDPPHYDAKTHNLVWGLLAKDDNGEEVINYNVRILGREGYMSVTLMDDPKMIDASKVEFAQVLERFSYKPGKTYAEWREGDKVAEYGLTALVAAGAGAAAVKMGLFAKLFKFVGKFAKVIIIGVAAAGAAVARAIRALFGRKSEGP